MREGEELKMSGELLRASERLSSGLQTVKLRRTPMGLWAPVETMRAIEVATESAPPVSAQNDESIPFWLTTVGYQDAFGDEPSGIEAIVRRLRRASLEKVVDVVGRIGATLNGAQPNERPLAAQARCALALFGKERLGRLDAQLRERLNLKTKAEWDRQVLFHERQCLNLLKVAFLILEPDAQPSEDLGAAAAIGEALLMMNDRLDAGLEDLDHQNDPAARNKLELHLFANSLFHHGASELADFSRAYDLFLTPRPGLPNTIDLRERLHRATGLEADTAWYALRALHGFFYVQGWDEASKDTLAISRDEGFTANFDLSVEESRAFFRAGSRTVDELRQMIFERYALDHLRTFDVLPFAQYPLVEFGPRVHCISIGLARDSAGMNLQHRFLDQHIFSRIERDQFLIFRGELFHDYVDRLLRRTYPVDRLLDGRTLQQRSERASGGQSCDAVINYGDAAILLEYKTALVKLPARAAESFEDYLKLVHEAFLEASEQLHATVSLIESGACIADGLDPSIIRRYYPIAVTMEISLNSGLLQRITEANEQRGLLQSPKCAPFQAFHVEDAELMETAVAEGYSFEVLMQGKVSEPFTATLSFKNFCFHAGFPWAGSRNPYLAQRFEEISERMQQFFHARVRHTGDQS